MLNVRLHYSWCQRKEFCWVVKVAPKDFHDFVNNSEVAAAGEHMTYVL